MNRQSAGNQIKETYERLSSVINTAKELNLPYEDVYSVVRKLPGYRSIKKRKVTSSYDKCFFEQIDSSIKAYFVGLIKADGYIDKNRLRIAIRLQEKDVELLEKFCDAIGFPHSRINKIPPRREGQSTHVEVAVTNRQLVEPLLDVKTQKIFEQIPPEFAWDFIRGYFDGDGTIAYRNLRRLYFSLAIVGSPSDPHMLEYIMDRIDGFTKIYIDKRSNLPYLKTDNALLIETFRKKLYDNSFLFLQRKRNKFDQFKLLFDTSTTKRKTSATTDEDIV